MRVVPPVAAGASSSAFTGARHTFASQYILVNGAPPYVLASDNVYLYENLRSHRPSATFDPADAPANLAAQRRMAALVCPANAVMPPANASPAQPKASPTASPNQSGDALAEPSCDRIVPGHDPAIFTRFPTRGRLAHIR